MTLKYLSTSRRNGNGGDLEIGDWELGTGSLATFITSTRGLAFSRSKDKDHFISNHTLTRPEDAKTSHDSAESAASWLLAKYGIKNY